MNKGIQLRKDSKETPWMMFFSCSCLIIAGVEG